MWHHESHTRCRDKLVRHLYWACDKDIYRLERRSGREDGTARQDDQHALEKQDCEYWELLLLFNPNINVFDADGGFPWLDRDTATQMLRTRRGRRRVASGVGGHSQGSGSITAECCTQNGCTWEEYAEYCPANNRAV